VHFLRCIRVKALLLLTVLAIAPLAQSQKSLPERWAVQLRSGHESLRSASNDAERLAQHDSLLIWWEAALNEGFGNSEAIEDLSSLLAIPEVGRGTDWVRVISWNVELEDRTQRYGGFVLKGAASGGYSSHALKQDLKADSWSNMSAASADDWPGAIYYDILLTRHKKQVAYTFLGWDGADGLVTRKMVQPIEFRRNTIRFGNRSLIGPEGNIHRWVLEYADDAVVTLRYEDQKERIVMDHLSPTAPHLKGSTAFYGPDMSYDAFNWHKGSWFYEPDVQVADPNLDAPYIAPPATRRRRG